MRNSLPSAWEPVACETISRTGCTFSVVVGRSLPYHSGGASYATRCCHKGGGTQVDPTKYSECKKEILRELTEKPTARTKDRHDRYEAPLRYPAPGYRGRGGPADLGESGLLPPSMRLERGTQESGALQSTATLNVDFPSTDVGPRTGYSGAAVGGPTRENGTEQASSLNFACVGQKSAGVVLFSPSVRRARLLHKNPREDGPELPALRITRTVKRVHALRRWVRSTS